MSEKNSKKKAGSKKNSHLLAERLKIATEGLYYVSEIDAPFTVIELSGEEEFDNLLESEDQIEKIDITRFFIRLTREMDWFGERERKRSKRYLDLQKLIEASMIEPVVYRIGRVKIRILILGRLEDGSYLGLETRAIET